jgi:hypothetical protein
MPTARVISKYSSPSYLLYVILYSHVTLDFLSEFLHCSLLSHVHLYTQNMARGAVVEYAVGLPFAERV